MSKVSNKIEVVDLRQFIVRGASRIRNDIPDDIFFYAVDTLLDKRRLDLTKMAADLGVSRMTIYRKVKDRDDLIGAVLLYLLQFLLQVAIQEGMGKKGVDALSAIIRKLFEQVSQQPALRFLLTNEPECALRLLTTKAGPINAHMVTFTEALLKSQETQGYLRPTMPMHALAYLLVKIGESFMYADIIADEPLDIDLAHRCVMGMLKTQAN